MTITESGGLGYKDGDDFRVRPQPWRKTEPDGGGGGGGGSGAQGPQGTSGNPGSQGSQGNMGGQGSQGSQGAPGPQGNQGTQGPQGVDGTIGDQGPAGDKGAILYARNKEEIVRVVCPELPETWFFDVVKSGSRVDPIFLSIIETETLRAIGPGVSIGDGIVSSKLPSDRILIGGIRKGFAGRRFIRQTTEQMERSRNFWKEQFA